MKTKKETMNLFKFSHIQIMRHLQNTTLYLFYWQNEYKFIPLAIYSSGNWFKRVFRD